MIRKGIKIIIMIFSAVFIFNPVIECKTASVDKQFAYAEGLFEIRQYSDATNEYIKVISLYPDNEFKDKAQFKIGECMSLMSTTGGMWLALGEWQKLIDKYPSSTLVDKAKENITLLKILLQKESLPILSEDDKVAERFLYFCKDYGWNSAYAGGFGIIYNAHFKEASLFWADKTSSDFPNSPFALTNALIQKTALYDAQVTKKDWLAEIGEYQKIIDQYPDSIYADRAQVYIGDIYETKLRNRKSALEAYQKLIDKRKSDPNNYYVSYAEAQIKYFK